MKERWDTVYISGGGSGIGLFLARVFATRGNAVAIFDRHIGQDVRDELSRLRPDACVFEEVDICDAPLLAQAATRAVDALGPPDLAINCAGIQTAKPFLALSADEFSRVINVNLVGSRNFAAALLPLMKDGSRLALVASLAGLVPNYTYSAYNASKFGVVGLAGALRMDCLSRGIAVSVICPPEVKTPMVEKELKTMDPITRELKQVAGTLELDQACREILAGLEKGDFWVIPGFRARLVWRLNRWFPGLLMRKIDSIILKSRKEIKQR